MFKKMVNKSLIGVIEDNDLDEIFKSLVKFEFKGDIEFYVGRF